jgi:hypothetical protein
MQESFVTVYLRQFLSILAVQINRLDCGVEQQETYFANLTPMPHKHGSRNGITHLRYFVAVAEAESLTVPAARKLSGSVGRRRRIRYWKQGSCSSRFIGPYLTHERLARPISKAKALGWGIGSIFCSRGQVR